MNSGDFSICHYFGWERLKINAALKRHRYLQLELLIALPPIPLMRSYHQAWLIKIQFTRPCSLECLSRCTGLVTLQTCKQMPALPKKSGSISTLVPGGWSLQGHLEEVWWWGVRKAYCVTDLFPASFPCCSSTPVKHTCCWQIFNRVVCVKNKTKHNMKPYMGGRNYLCIKRMLG